ncbi:hypothetical protein ON010_g140 [Phytophthora cinnamomi]|nr:hypothetical protein ON010_g140 [Phytophthora cinnamomi]
MSDLRRPTLVVSASGYAPVGCQQLQPCGRGGSRPSGDGSGVARFQAHVLRSKLTPSTCPHSFAYCAAPVKISESIAKRTTKIPVGNRSKQKYAQTVWTVPAVSRAQTATQAAHRNRTRAWLWPPPTSRVQCAPAHIQEFRCEVLLGCLWSSLLNWPPQAQLKQPSSTASRIATPAATMAPNQQPAATTAEKPTAGPKPMSAHTIAILKATAPVVKEHGTEITSTMYGIMFSEFPEVQNLFNMSHHRVAGATKGGAPPGVSRQATTLANAVIGFAANCDQLGNLGDAVPRMVHKHVSLDIRAKHYPIVGGCLLRAIKIVLGDAATDEIMDAWKEAYWFLADLLIQAEDNLRTEFEDMPGGWAGFRELPWPIHLAQV